MHEDTGWGKIWATIGYGWASVDYYRKRVGPGYDADELKGPYLDRLNAQTEYSYTFLDLFKTMIESPEYVQRLERHYRIFREKVDRIENRRTRLRDPRRRRRH